MPNKDSFTFSDKLRKSKSLPLSKRIPSKIGGDGKAKRTLIQRAQRDLPFIIVAAAALLLLPILSRDSGSEYGPTGTGYADFVPADNSAVGAPDYYGSGQDIAPSSGFRDPLSLIKRKSGEDSRNSFDPSEDITNLGSDEGVVRDRPSYSEPYRPAAKKAVRKAIARKATAIGSLRTGKAVSGDRSGGVTKALNFGTARQATGGTSIREGVRPVALQPLTSAGKGGRSMTGEGLYAEAARSLGAMNRGSAKQALFDSQLKNVDGTPLGAAGAGTGFGAGAMRNGGGGAPTDKFGYMPKTPWWWDFEKQKLMDKWRNWEGRLDKTLSDITFKIGTGLAYCLLTGSEDGSVKYFAGKKPGDDASVCMKDGKAIMRSFEDISASTSGTDKDGGKTSGTLSYKEYEDSCIARGGKVEIDPAGKKNPLQTRAECLGFKLKGFKKRVVGEKSSCGGVYGPNKSVNFSSNKAGDAEYIGVYVLVDSKPIGEGNSKGAITSKRVAHIQKGGSWNGGDRLSIQEQQYYVTDVVGFKVKGFYRGDGSQNPLNSASTKSCKDYERLASEYAALEASNKREASVTVDEKGKTEEQIKKENDTITASKKNAADKLTALGKKRDAAQTKCGTFKDKTTNIGKGDNENELSAKVNKQDIDRIKAEIASGIDVTEAYVQKELHITPIQTCTVPSDFRDTKFGAAEMGEDQSPRTTCLSPEIFRFTGKGRTYDFAAKIDSVPPNAEVHAVVVEKTAAGDNEGKVIVRKVAPNVGKRGDYYVFKASPAEIGNAKVDTINGQGFVYWIVTKPDVELTVKEQDIVRDIGNARLAAQRFVSKPDMTVGVCEYLWGCNKDDCDEKKAEANENICFEGKDIYLAEHKGGKILKTGEPISDDKLQTIAPSLKDIECTEKSIADIRAQILAKDIYACAEEEKQEDEIKTDVKTAEKSGTCSIDIKDTFVGGKYQFNDEASAQANIEKETETLFNCLNAKDSEGKLKNRRDVTINVDGFTSSEAGGPAYGKLTNDTARRKATELNKALSEARALRAAKIIRDNLKKRYADKGIPAPVLNIKATPSGLKGFSDEDIFVKTYADDNVSDSEIANRNEAFSTANALKRKCEKETEGASEKFAALADAAGVSEQNLKDLKESRGILLKALAEYPDPKEPAYIEDVLPLQEKYEQNIKAIKDRISSYIANLSEEEKVEATKSMDIIEGTSFCKDEVIAAQRALQAARKVTINVTGYGLEKADKSKIVKSDRKISAYVVGRN